MTASTWPRQLTTTRRRSTAAGRIVGALVVVATWLAGPGLELARRTIRRFSSLVLQVAGFASGVWAMWQWSPIAGGLALMVALLTFEALTTPDHDEEVDR